VKFDLLKDRISGALAFYDNNNYGEIVSASTAQVDLFNPAGINGRFTGIGSATGMHVKARGTELSVTMKPAKGWRMIFAAGTTDAKTIERSLATILYNDQFHVIGTTVAVKSPSGDLTPLLVPSVRTDPNSARVPLTIAMMRDPSSSYFAQLDPSSGRIVNANSLFLNTNGVATGVSGLPISQHQIGFQAPGNGIAAVFEPGDLLSPLPGKSAMFNTTYTFSDGPLNGLSVGGLLSWRGDYRIGYAVIDGKRQLYYAPEQVRADLRLGYNWILGPNRSISFQLSASNVTDKQTLLTNRNIANGVVTSVSVVEAPRSYVLTANLRF
jgi:outer membrane receptor protein involved in Fe transport